MAPKVAALDVAADPFAAPPPTSTLPMSTGVPVTQPDPELQGEPSGLPVARPGWLLPVVVGLLALVVGGAVTLVVMMH